MNINLQELEEVLSIGLTKIANLKKDITISEGRIANATKELTRLHVEASQTGGNTGALNTYMNAINIMTVQIDVEKANLRNLKATLNEAEKQRINDQEALAQFKRENLTPEEVEEFAEVERKDAESEAEILREDARHKQSLIDAEKNSKIKRTVIYILIGFVVVVLGYIAMKKMKL